MTIDYKALAAAAAAKTNMTEAQKGGGGGEYTPPAAGACKLRLVAYVELGKHRDEWKGEVKIKDKVQLTFELSGPNHPPKVLDDGTKIPVRMNITETLSLHEKANFFKLFNKLRNGQPDVAHFAQLLGEPFLGKVVHKKSKDGQKTFAQLRELTGEYTVRPAFIETEDEDGNLVQKKVKVDPALSPLRLFIWDLASKEMWDSLFIEGEYAARDDGTPAKSKNVLQNKIKGAINFKGSPIEAILGGVDDLGDQIADDHDDEDYADEEPVKPTKPSKPAPTKGAAADPLADLDDEDDIAF